MADDDPLVNGVPLSSLRVVDLKDELDKLGLSKIGNKSVLTERLKNHLCGKEAENVNENESDGGGGGDNEDNAEKEKTPEKWAPLKIRSLLST